MKTFLLTLILSLLALVSPAQSQSPFRLQAKCTGAYSRSYTTITATATGITHVPCPTRSNIFTGVTDWRQGTAAYGSNLTLGDADFVSFYNATGRLLTVGYNLFTDRRTLTPNQRFGLTEFGTALTLNGATSLVQGNSIWLDIQGTGGGGTIRGQAIDIFSNSSFPTAGTELIGTDVNVDTGGAYTSVYGGRFSALMGGSGASGVGTYYGIQASVGAIHNGNTTNAYAGEFWLSSSAGSAGTLDNGVVINTRTSVRSGATFTSLKWLNLAGDVPVGSVGTSYGIYANASIDQGTTNRYFIYSESTSPSVFSVFIRSSQDVYITDTTKGIVLRSPDNTCYRFTVANGGALSAGAAITCP